MKEKENYFGPIIIKRGELKQPFSMRVEASEAFY